MLSTRIIPTLLLDNESLVKSVRFKNFHYIGDPANTVRIFNELEVDEIIFLDTTATFQKRIPNYKILNEIANECFMPLGYGGGIPNIEIADKIFRIGFEKVVINSNAEKNPILINQLSKEFGSQAVVVSIDYKKNVFGKKTVRTINGKKNTNRNPIEYAKEVEQLGAGEILLTSIDHEGTWSGFDIEMIKSLSEAVSIPVIAHGGAGSIEDIVNVIKFAAPSAVALGSMVVYQKKGKGVLVNYPETKFIQDKINQSSESSKQSKLLSN